MATDIRPTIFKAYDIRGIFPSEINKKAAQKIGKAYARVCKPEIVAVGQDVRASGRELKEALVSSLVQSGINVVDLGIITTDQLYFAVGHYGYDGGISVTASHNPGEYNGFKFVERGGAPIASSTLADLKKEVSSGRITTNATTGKLLSRQILDDYVKFVLSCVDTPKIRPMKVAANANFGAVGRSVDKLAAKLGLSIERLNWQEDGTFPKGPPNPLYYENRVETGSVVRSAKAAFGVAWDADADRCFFFTESGKFIPSCYIVALLAAEILKNHPGATIVHDLTNTWVVDDSVQSAAGEAIACRTGHTFIKACMRQNDAIFAGESSGHFYFKQSFSADNGIIPFLMILRLVSISGKSLGQLVRPLMEKVKVSDEINFTVSDVVNTLAKLEDFAGTEDNIDKTDGLIVEAKDYRFSVRPSNTEPLLRLNAEAKTQDMLDKVIAKLTNTINGA